MRNIILLSLIILLSALLRLYALDQFPAGFNADEAAIGYNAYSLIKTGRDEYGMPWPIQFKSFGDYKPGLYFYLVTPFVAALGLNEWAVRFPSALLGVATVVLAFFLAKEIFKKESIALLTSLLLAITPWHIHFSRGGWEANAATFFITLAILFFLKGLKSAYYLFFSLVAFLASMYTYQSPRLVVPLLLLILFLLYKNELIGQLKDNILKSSIGLILLFVMSFPLLFQFTSESGSARFTGLSFLSDTGPVSRINELRGEHFDPSSNAPKLLHNKVTAYGVNFLGHYLDHFRPDFLFINGDPIIRNKVPETGQFYLIFALFLVAGLFFLINADIKDKKLLLAWVLIAPLASSMTFQTPHALRAHNILIPLMLVISYGLWRLLGLIGKRYRIFAIIVIFFILCFELVRYLESYFVHYPKRYPLSWEYGFNQMVNKLSMHEKGYDKVIITDKYDQPYILVLFYKRYDPSTYQPQAVLSSRDKFNFGTVRNFDKYEFRTIDWKNDNKLPNTLIIGTEDEIPKDVKILDMVYFPNNQPAFIFTGT